MSLGPYTGFDCAVCAGPMHWLGWLGTTYHMRCRNCGADEFADESKVDIADQDEDEEPCHWCGSTAERVLGEQADRPGCEGWLVCPDCGGC